MQTSYKEMDNCYKDTQNNIKEMQNNHKKKHQKKLKKIVDVRLQRGVKRPKERLKTLQRKMTRLGQI